MKLVIDTESKSRFTKNETYVILEQLVKRGVGNHFNSPYSMPGEKDIYFDRFSSAWFIALHVFDNLQERCLIHEMIDEVLQCVEVTLDRGRNPQSLRLRKEAVNKADFYKRVKSFLEDAIRYDREMQEEIYRKIGQCEKR